MTAPVVLLVRYGELSLKSPYVRRQLEDRLVANAQAMFAANGVECVVRRERGRIFVHAEDEAVAVRLLRRVFGIVSISPAKETTSDLATLTRDAVGYARGVLTTGRSFAIRARRSGEHPYTSQDLGRTLGRAIQDAIPGLAVNLNAPDAAVHVEVRGRRAYVFHEVVRGTGGLPLGSAGEVLAPVVDDDGLVAAWLMMRRGCRAVAAADGEFVDVLRQWDPKLVAVEPQPWPDLVRLAAAKGLAGIVVPAAEMAAAVDGLLPLLPLAGLTKGEVADLARRIREPP